jgi:ribosomal-protein-serine acetyltransferase
MPLEKFPILLDLPISFETERLLIRPAYSGDGPLVHQAVQQSLNDLKPWLPWATSKYSLDSAESSMRLFDASYVLRNAFHHLIFSEDRFVGMVSISLINWDIPSANVGYWCSSLRRRNGFMKEAVTAVTQFAFEKLSIQRLYSVCDEENIASQKVAKGAYYSLELKARGLLKKPEADDLRMCHLYSRFKDVEVPSIIPIHYQY